MKSKKGFVLTELITVIIIFGVILTVGALSFSIVDRLQINSAMRALQSDLRHVKRIALNEKVQARIVFDETSNVYTLEKMVNNKFVTVKTVEPQAKIKSINASGKTVSFTTRGTTGSACTIVLTHGGYEGSLTVNVGGGRAKVTEIRRI